jgi:hypothetical protein
MFFEMGGALSKVISPVKMQFGNEHIAKTAGLPLGYYWGIYLGNERAGAWKIDIWAVSWAERERLLKYCSDINLWLVELYHHYPLH